MDTSKEITLALDKAKKEGANLLLPSTTLETLSEFHQPVIDSVVLSSEADDGDIYLQEKGTGKKPSKYAIAKQGLLKLSNCAGVIWHPTETRRTDNRADRNYVSYQAVGGVRKTDGTPIFFKAEYDVDFEVVEDEIREQYRLKAQKYESAKGDEDYKWWHKKSKQEKADYLENCVRRDLLQKRKHKLKLAETGAMNRVIRALLNLKNTYTKAELQKPFVIARIVLKPDYNDPEVKRLLVEASVKAMTQIYGPESASDIFQPVDLPHEVAIEELKNVSPDTTESGAADEDPGDLEPDGEAMGDSLEVDFQNQDNEGKIKTLLLLAHQKDYDVAKKLKKPLAKFTDGELLGFFQKLQSMNTVNENPF